MISLHIFSHLWLSVLTGAVESSLHLVRLFGGPLHPFHTSVLLLGTRVIIWRAQLFSTYFLGLGVGVVCGVGRQISAPWSFSHDALSQRAASKLQFCWVFLMLLDLMSVMWNSFYFEARNRLGGRRHGPFFSEKKNDVSCFLKKQKIQNSSCL